MIIRRFVRYEAQVILCLVALITLILAGCGAAQVTDVAVTAAPRVTLTSSPTVSSTSSLMDTPVPTPTTTPTIAPSSTATATPTPTPTPTHPLMIEVMREQDYPGSDLVIEETLSPGVNYDRYIVSYLSEGLKIYALLTVPQGEKPETGWPIIVFNHGHITPDLYCTTERYVAYQDAFARNGYIVIKPDYRGHGASEGKPSNTRSSPDYTVDVLNAMASVQRYPDADPDRVGMWGHSMGGDVCLERGVADALAQFLICQWHATSSPLGGPFGRDLWFVRGKPRVLGRHRPNGAPGRAFGAVAAPPFDDG